MGHFFGIQYLYLWYNHTILVSNDCVRVINPCGLFSDCIYCFQSHLSVFIGMVIRCFPVSSYMCTISFCSCMVCVSTFISLSGLHSFLEMCMSGMTNGGGISSVSVLHNCEISIYYIFVKCMLFFGVVVY